MAASLAPSFPVPSTTQEERRDTLPVPVARLLTAGAGQDADEAWATFLDAYSPLLLRIAAAFAPGYDGALDRYTYMLDELRRNDCRRLRAYAADGRGRFSTWLTVVARRLCLDHYRQHFGRVRGPEEGVRARATFSRALRRRLSELSSPVEDLTLLPDLTLRDPGEVVDEHDRRAALRRALNELRPGDQLLLRLRFEEDLTAREIAPLLGLASQFHVYRRIETVCGMVRARLTARAGRTGAGAPAGALDVGSGCG
jgi:RNA polymerase sigma factor (sigma-70 family)